MHAVCVWGVCVVCGGVCGGGVRGVSVCVVCVYVGGVCGGWEYARCVCVGCVLDVFVWGVSISCVLCVGRECASRVVCVCVCKPSVCGVCVCVCEPCVWCVVCVCVCVWSGCARCCVHAV